MTLNEAIRHCEQIAVANEAHAQDSWEKGGYEERACIECAKEHRQLAKWLKTLATINDMLDGTIDHLSGDDAKELLNDIKRELKPIQA